jgi:colicin import membrane protein
MSTATANLDPLRPQRPGGMGKGLSLALLVHAGLLVAIAFSVNWRSSTPAGVEAELWAAVPQIAAPKPVEPEPQPTPKPPEPPPPPKVQPVEKVPDAQIAIEKAKREEEKRKEEAKREEQQRLKEEQERKQAELDRKKKEAEQKRKEEERAAAVAAKARQDQMDRIAALAGSGEPNSPGTAARTAGPSASYAGRIIARLRPLSVFSDAVAGNPKAEVSINVGPDGTIIGRKLTKSSGVPAWDDAVLRAIDKAESLPRDVDGRVQNPTLIVWGPKD